MREKQAREILSKHSLPLDEEMKRKRGKYIYVLGYPEAIEKVRPLVKEIKKHLGLAESQETGEILDMFENLDNVKVELAKYEEEK